VTVGALVLAEVHVGPLLDPLEHVPISPDFASSGSQCPQAILLHSDFESSRLDLTRSTRSAPPIADFVAIGKLLGGQGSCGAS
jgi:hypothetical protein